MSLIDEIMALMNGAEEVPGELINIDPNQVHLVDWPANGDTRVFIQKRDNTMADISVTEGAAPAAAPPAEGGAAPPPSPEGMTLSPGVKGAMMGLLQSSINGFGDLMTKVNGASDGDISDNTIPKGLVEAVEGQCEALLQGLKMYKAKRRIAPWMPHFKAFTDLIGDALNQLEGAHAAAGGAPIEAPAVAAEAAAAPAALEVAVAKSVHDLRTLIDGQKAEFDAARAQDQATIKGLQTQLETIRSMAPASGALPVGQKAPAPKVQELSATNIRHLNINDLRAQQERERKASVAVAKESR